MSKALIETLLAAPYVARFGVRLEQKGDELTGILPYSEILVGKSLIPALLGGLSVPFSRLLLRFPGGRSITRAFAAADQCGD